MTPAASLKILFLFLVFNVQSQVNRYALSVDTVIEYRDGITKEVHLHFTGKKQGIYWNTLPKNHQVHSLKIFAKNNTGKPILVTRVPNPDGRISFLGQGNTILKPGESMSISAIVQFVHTPFSRSLDIEYQLDGTPQILHIPTWGIMDEQYIRKTSPENAQPLEQPAKSNWPKVVHEGNRVITYNNSGSCPASILQVEPNKRIEYLYDTCKLFAINTEFTVKKRTYRILEKGIFENDTLKNGKREVYFDRRNLSYSINVRNGENTDTLFHNQVVNKYNTSGQKTGYWILTGKQCDYSINWQEVLDCDVCKELYFSGKKNGPDTISVFDLNGRLSEKTYFSTDSVYRITRKFYPNGLKMSELYEYINKLGTGNFSITFSDSIPGEPIRKNYSDLTELFYRNGKVIQKISPKFGYTMSLEMPVEFEIPYTKESGFFKGETLYNGRIEYYDKYSKLLRTEKIVNGKAAR